MNEKIRNFLRIDKSGRIRNFFRRENLAKLFRVEKIKAFFLADRLTDRLKEFFRVEQLKALWKTDRKKLLPYAGAVAGVVLVSVIGVLVVRAYLTAKTNFKNNPFAPMTYTNTQIEETVTSMPQPPSEQEPDIVIRKRATVKNLAGSDKKPVYVRVALTWSVYDDEGVNVTSQYPVKSLSFTHADGWSCKGDDGWAGRNDDPYYYYNAIVLPGTSTTELFGGDITMDFDSKLPKDYKVEIDVIADTVQAVSIDTSKWKEAGGTFSDTEVKQAWSMKPTNLPSVEATGSNLAITWTKTTT